MATKYEGLTTAQWKSVLIKHYTAQQFQETGAKYCVKSAKCSMKTLKACHTSSGCKVKRSKETGAKYCVK